MLLTLQKQQESLQTINNWISCKCTNPTDSAHTVIVYIGQAHLEFETVMLNDRKFKVLD